MSLGSKRALWAIIPTRMAQIRSRGKGLCGDKAGRSLKCCETKEVCVWESRECREGLAIKRQEILQRVGELGGIGSVRPRKGIQIDRLNLETKSSTAGVMLAMLQGLMYESHIPHENKGTS